MNDAADRARIERLEVEKARLEEENAFLRAGLGAGLVLPANWRLSPTERALVACIYRRHMATHDVLLNAICAGTGRDETSMESLRVTVCKARAKMKPHGHGLITLWGIGFSMGPCTRALIDAMQVDASREAA